MRFRKLAACAPLLAVSLFAAATLSSSACSTEPPYTPPRATILLNPAPVAIDPAALSLEVELDPEQTAKQYLGTDLYFHLVPVEGMDLASPFIQSGPVRFIPSSPESIEKLKVGDNVDVVGRLTGSNGGKIVISGCWIKKVEPGKPQGY